MPKNTKVERCYTKLFKSGKSKGSAAAICQSATGLSLQTGKKPKEKEMKQVYHIINDRPFTMEELLRNTEKLLEIKRYLESDKFMSDIMVNKHDILLRINE